MEYSGIIHPVYIKDKVEMEEVPLNSGAMFQTLILPAFMNWPRAISRKKIGIPPRNINRPYGMRKTPKGQT